MKIKKNKNNIVETLFAIFLFNFVFLLHGGNAFTATYYVSPSGNSQWDVCTDITSPCSANTALQNAQAGDLVYFRNGTYDPGSAPSWENPAWNPANSGTNGNPITFMAYPGETPLVLTNANGPAYGARGRDYIVWDGFKSNSVSHHGMAFFNSNHNTVQNCEMKGHDQGSLLGNNHTIRIEKSSFITIRNCKLYGNKGRGSNSTGIEFYTTNNVLIENNEIFGNNTGIFNKVDGSHYTYRNNFIHDNSGKGIILAASPGTPDVGITGSYIYNNIFANNGTNIKIQEQRMKKDIQIYKNSFYNGNKGVGASSGKADGLKIHNNIMHTISTVHDLRSTTNISADNNCFFNSSGIDGRFDRNSIFSKDPLYSNPGGATPSSYKLQTGSPCSGKGAYATGNESIGLGEFNNTSIPINTPFQTNLPSQTTTTSPAASSPPLQVTAIPSTPFNLNTECADRIIAHPEWIFCDDFEDGTSLVGSGRYFEYDNNNGDFIVKADVGIGNSKGMRTLWQANEVSAGSIKLGFGRNPNAYMSTGIRSTEDFRDIYYRMYLRMESGWQGNPGKLSRATIFISSNSWAQAMAAHLWGGESGNTLEVDPVGCVDVNSNVKCTKHNDFANFKWLGLKSGSTSIFDGNHNNQWFCIEHHVKLNDPGASNGIQEFWIDDKLEASKTNLNFVNSYTDYGINAVFFENYTNQGSPKEQERYFDNIVVSTERIGCSDKIKVENQLPFGAGTNPNNSVPMNNPPPSPPSGLHIQ